MRQRLTRISVAQTAGVLALVYLVISALFFIPFALFALAVPGVSRDMGFGGGGFVLFFVMPLVYAVVTFVVIGLFALIYNFISGRVGGIEVTWDAAPGGTGTPAA